MIQTIPQTGKVEWLGVRPSRRAAMSSVNKIEVSESNGLKDDHYSGRDRKRQVTLIQWEHLDVIASVLAMECITPEILRRNIAVSGINLLALKDQIFRTGQVVLEFTGYCHPCSYIEETLGPGAYNAVRGHGGITARVINGGIINLGDDVSLVKNEN